MISTSPRFGRLLRRLRHERNLSQLELAATAGASTRHLSFLETGRARPSEAMVARLAAALNLDRSGIDDLRMAAGFCSLDVRCAARIGDRVFESALEMEEAATPAQITEAARKVLPELGVTQFFFGALGDDANPGFAWASFGAFPVAWLQRYDRRRYATTDPLLAAARARTGSFSWGDVIDRRSLTRPAREMFDSAEALGISSGFVVSRRRPDGIQLVSMMGSHVDSRSRSARLGLEIMGSRMLTALDRLGALSPSVSGRGLPPG
jgi:transcriptional regulator with XRE-family HTH domain